MDGEGKKPRLNKRKRNKMDQTPCPPASNAVAAATGKSGDDCTDVVAVLGDAEVSMNPRNGEVNIGEKGTPERKKPNRKKGKKKNMQKQQLPPSAVSDVEVDKSRTDCKEVEDVPGDDETIRSPRNEEDPGFSAVKIAEQEIQESKKPRRKKTKINKQEQSPSAVSDVEVDKSRTDCKDVPGDDETIRSPRIEEDPGFSAVKIAEQEIPERKKPKRKKRKINKQEQSPSAVSDIEVDKSRTDCKDVEDVPGNDETIRSPRNEEDPGFSAVKIAEQEMLERKKPRRKKRKINKQEQSPSAVTDGNAVVVGTSENNCTHGKCVPGVVDVNMSSRNEEDQVCPEVNIAEKETPKRKKPKLKKPKKNKQERSPDVVSDEGAVQLHKTANVCIDGDASSGDAQVSMSTRSVEHLYCPEVNIAEQETNGRKKPKPKKWKNKKEGSSSVVLDAVVADESRNGCTDGDGLPHDIDASICPRNGEDQDCPAVKNAEKEIPKRKKRKKKNQEQSPSLVLDAGDVVMDKSGHDSTNVGAQSGGDPDCPAVKNAEKRIPEMYKPKHKKRKKKNQEQSPSPVLDAGDVVMDKSGHDSTNVGAQSGGADVTISPRKGEGREYSKLNTTDDLLEGNKVKKGDSQKSKLKKRMKNKHEQSPSAVPDTCVVVEDKSGKSYIDGKGSLGDTEISTSPSTGKDRNCPEVNMANDLVEGNNGNNNSQKPKNRNRKRKRRDPVAVIETPPVGDVSSDERKDVCRTGSMKVTAKPDIISVTSSSGENHKENAQNIYSPEGSLVRSRRKKLLILDLNGILADINTDRNFTHLADGKLRGKHGKHVFKRNYLDDFLRFCFENFELGIWSSRMKVNVDGVVDILMKDLRRHLVFCWDVSHCTTTEYYTLENYRKPLVLKELKKLWDKEDPDLPWEQGEFSPSNTLLVDDSPYKALRNPPYTAIFPQTYSLHMKDDKSLGPGGDLRVYLENIAAADDVQRYVQEHPFGQPPITERDPNWNFYSKIHYRRDRVKW